MRKPVPSFGKNGAVDLTKGLGRDISGLEYDVTCPGAIYKGLIILGSESITHSPLKPITILR
jgi:quinoprotein glucose dehydrogenase